MRLENLEPARITALQIQNLEMRIAAFGGCVTIEAKVTATRGAAPPNIWEPLILTREEIGDAILAVLHAKREVLVAELQALGVDCAASAWCAMGKPDPVNDHKFQRAPLASRGPAQNKGGKQMKIANFLWPPGQGDQVSLQPQVGCEHQCSLNAHGFALCGPAPIKGELS